MTVPLSAILHVVVEALGYASLLGGAVTWLLSGYTAKMSADEKRAFTLRRPRLAGVITALTGAGLDRAKIRKGMLMVAKGLKAAPVVALLELLPDDDADDRITLADGPPLVASLPQTVAPPPPPAVLLVRPAVDGRHSGVDPEEAKAATCPTCGRPMAT